MVIVNACSGPARPDRGCSSSSPAMSRSPSATAWGSVAGGGPGPQPLPGGDRPTLEPPRCSRRTRRRSRRIHHGTAAELKHVRWRGRTTGTETTGEIVDNVFLFVGADPAGSLRSRRHPIGIGEARRPYDRRGYPDDRCAPRLPGGRAGPHTLTAPVESMAVRIRMDESGRRGRCAHLEKGPAERERRRTTDAPGGRSRATTEMGWRGRQTLGSWSARPRTP